ncbi:hypothetical protein [Fictibacillus fluitans]|uniref:Uncharacterized protein n=1 Tax=Fictibacillus fluitans TaxID=3058422 RepID=A0ABT8I1R5_9BACL|nr:hypothetical protein [Fictibacillus sp. NE201]MDN4526978.1 hypothetical protein [Fictibacillus sp. NE201]
MQDEIINYGEIEVGAFFGLGVAFAAAAARWEEWNNVFSFKQIKLVL